MGSLILPRNAFVSISPVRSFFFHHRHLCPSVKPSSASSPKEKKKKKKKNNTKDSSKTITIRSKDLNAWYLDEYLNVKFKETGYSNMYFPQLIPYSFIEKEAKPCQGFQSRTRCCNYRRGGKELEEKLVVTFFLDFTVDDIFNCVHEVLCDLRPTSETIVNHMFTQWIDSYRDLPLMVNQWVNVTRWEMRTKPFLRTLVFLWQEGHTAHELQRRQRRRYSVETFAGATRTYTIEAMMGDKRLYRLELVIILVTFGTKFTDESGQKQHVWQTSWAISTRFVGATVLDAAVSIEKVLKTSGIKVKMDDSKQRTPGWNFFHCQGVPVRIKIGPRDVSSDTMVVSRKDVPGKQGKDFGISMEPSILEFYVKGKMGEIQSSLLERVKAFRDSNIVDVNSYNELKEAISQGKLARGPWSSSETEELKVKQETGATIRCFLF
ncbi:hypothetical protein AQUCO_01900073v1 [Aquilegia coerulea]|uniref:proline--tRNA ligase n=1 Tax=Aquilegia coerulea TaxID=218851 RepID=A0A2G5DIR7_AQUCA|nr:hypothetical protein AQUCO_01900073v1 [Aquilegia coerulea]